jgi:hypothetical protein
MACHCSNGIFAAFFAMFTSPVVTQPLPLGRLFPSSEVDEHENMIFLHTVIIYTVILA